MKLPSGLSCPAQPARVVADESEVVVESPNRLHPEVWGGGVVGWGSRPGRARRGWPDRR